MPQYSNSSIDFRRILSNSLRARTFTSKLLHNVPMKLFLNLHRRFSSLSSSSSSSSSSLPWISPLQYRKPTTPQTDPPPQTSSSLQRRPKFITHASAITMIKREKTPQHAVEIFNMVTEQRGFNHNHSTYFVILYKLAKWKKFKAVDAILKQMTFDTCKFEEGIILNLMIQFSKCSLHEKTLEMFFAIQPLVREKPSLKAISTCLNLLIEYGQIDLARNFLVELKRRLDLKPNTCIFNILVKHHCKKGDMDSAFEVVKVMRKAEVSYPNLITYSTLIGGLCNTGRLKEAIDLFEGMISKAILPDTLTYNILINGFCRGGKVDRAKNILNFMKKNGCQPNIFNYTALMNGLSKDGRLEEVKEVFDEMRNSGLEVDGAGYTTLISCLCRSGRVDDAVNLLKEMKLKECNADCGPYNVVFGGLCREGRFEEAMGMLERLPYEGMYLDKASYRIVLNFLLKEKETERAVYVLSLMLGRGFVPHFGTSNELLISFCEAGKVVDATTALYRLVEKGFKPEYESWFQLVDSVCRERKLVKIFSLIDELVTG